MKRFFYAILAVVIAACTAFGQHASNQITYMELAPDKVNILKASMEFHESDENVFWPLFEQYEQKLNSLKETTVESLQQLTLNVEKDKAQASVQRLLANQRDEALLKKEYFEKIISSTNGTLALQFLQGEALYDLLLKSRLYDKMTWSHPAWSPSVLKHEEVKQTMVEFTLGVSQSDSSTFRQLMQDFEFDYSRIVGHQFLFFEQYIDDANELTPGQCKRLGNAFLAMQQNEVKVKEKYFEKFNTAFGADFAARFIALQEYFNMMSKLKVWSDYISVPDGIQR